MKPSIVVANWKMNKTITEAVEYARQLKKLSSGLGTVEVVVAAPFTVLQPLQQVLQQTKISLAAQNIHWEDSGPYTGEVSPLQVRDAGCRHVILGHSERRQYFGEGYDQVNRKIHGAWRHQLHPIVCLGETKVERDANQTLTILAEQMEKGLAEIPADLLEHLVIAYEPVWAIGTGHPVAPKQASESHGFIRQKVKDLFGSAASASVRVLYGGSVTAENTLSLMAEPEVDGLLVGGASLEYAQFAEIVQHATRRES
jgi:triosephosphate isomerase (TIM)